MVKEAARAELEAHRASLACIDPLGASTLQDHDLDGRPMAELAAELGMARWRLYKIRARALARLQASAARERAYLAD